jgi:hypothetical protein
MPASRVTTSPPFQVILRREDQIGPLVVIISWLQSRRFKRRLSRFVPHALILSGFAADPSHHPFLTWACLIAWCSAGAGQYRRIDRRYWTSCDDGSTRSLAEKNWRPQRAREKNRYAVTSISQNSTQFRSRLRSRLAPARRGPINQQRVVTMGGAIRPMRIFASRGNSSKDISASYANRMRSSPYLGFKRHRWHNKIIGRTKRGLPWCRLCQSAGPLP